MADLKQVNGEVGTKRTKLKDFANLLAIQVGEDWPPLADHIRQERQLASRNNLLLGLGMCAALALIWASAFWFGAPAMALAAFAGLPCLIAFEKLRRTTVARDHWIVEQPEEGEFLVEIFIEADGVVMGSDRGILWFDQAAVHFNGQRTWFRIALLHIHDRRVRDNLTKPYDELSPGQTTIRVSYSEAKVRIKIVEVPVPGRSANHDFEEHIKFLKSLGVRSPDPTTLPPLTLDPEYRHDIFRNTEMRSYNYWSFLVAAFIVACVRTTLFDDFLAFGLAIAYTIYLPIGRLIWPAQVRAHHRRKRDSG